MKSVTTVRFRKCYSTLPIHIKEASRKAFRLWKANPNYPSLQFKQIHETMPIYAVRVGLAWRAVGIKQNNTLIWFWIGSHEDYNNLIASL